MSWPVHCDVFSRCTNCPGCHVGHPRGSVGYLSHVCLLLHNVWRQSTIRMVIRCVHVFWIHSRCDRSCRGCCPLGRSGCATQTLNSHRRGIPAQWWSVFQIMVLFNAEIWRPVDLGNEMLIFMSKQTQQSRAACIVTQVRRWYCLQYFQTPFSVSNEVLETSFCFSSGWHLEEWVLVSQPGCLAFFASRVWEAGCRKLRGPLEWYEGFVVVDLMLAAVNCDALEQKRPLFSWMFFVDNWF